MVSLFQSKSSHKHLAIAKDFYGGIILIITVETQDSIPISSYLIIVF